MKHKSPLQSTTYCSQGYHEERIFTLLSRKADNPTRKARVDSKTSGNVVFSWAPPKGKHDDLIRHMLERKNGNWVGKVA